MLSPPSKSLSSSSSSSNTLMTSSGLSSSSSSSSSSLSKDPSVPRKDADGDVEMLTAGMVDAAVVDQLLAVDSFIKSEQEISEAVS